MPYEWLPPKEDGKQALRLWPHRSLPRRGFVFFIGATAALISLPLLKVLGTAALWGLLPFLIMAVGGVYWALQRSYRDGEILETLTLAADTVDLTRIDPHGHTRHWQANPHWVQVELHKTGGPVPHYITLKGGPREVELGTFLSEAERIELAQDLRTRLNALKPH